MDLMNLMNLMSVMDLMDLMDLMNVMDLMDLTKKCTDSLECQSAINLLLQSHVGCLICAQLYIWWVRVKGEG